MPLKYCGSLRFSDSEIPPAKAQRRQVRRGRKNILANGFHHFSPTFAAFASLRETFRVSVAAVRRQGEPFFPAQSGKMRVLLCLKVFAACANFPSSVTLQDGDLLAPSRKTPSSETFSFYLCAFASLREIFRFFWLRLRRARAIVSSFHSLCLVANMDQGSGARRERQRRLNSAERRRDVIETFLRRLHEQENRFVCLARIR